MLTDDESKAEPKRDIRELRRLLVYLRPYRKRVILALVLSTCSSMLLVAVPTTVAYAIDHYILPKDGSAPYFPGVMLMAGLFMGAILMNFAIEMVNFVLVARVGQEVMRDLRMQIFSHIQELSLSYFDRNPVGRLITRVTNDVETLNELLSSGIINIIQQVLLLVGILIVLMVLNWKLFLATAVVFPFVYIAAWNFRTQTRKHFRETRRRLAKMNAYIQENVTGMRTVQAFTKEARQQDRFRGLNQDYRDANIKTVFQYSMFFPVVEAAATTALAIVIWRGGSQVLQHTMTIGGLAFFIQSLERFFMPVKDLSERYNLVQASLAASERIFELLDEKPAITEPAGAPRTLTPMAQRIEFKDVWLAYKDEQWVLKGVSFTIEKGQSVALVGPTGSGKTSIISLLCRFYDFQRGDILIDGVSVRELPLKLWRRQIALVLQDVFLFYGDVATNIRLGETNITDEQVRQAAERVQAAPFIDRLPRGYQSGVKERGATLSVGQKQLLAFARALAFDPQLLILDEATANIDTETESLIQSALDELLKGRTSLVIAHRLSTVQRANKIVVLHHGKVAEEGTLAELLARDGLYRRLHDLQFAGERDGKPHRPSTAAASTNIGAMAPAGGTGSAAVATPAAPDA